MAETTRATETAEATATTRVNGKTEGQAGGATRHKGLEDLFSYPLMTAITERRTRRVAQGVSLQAAGLSYTSPNAPAPLSPLEEAVLIVSTGLTGITMHDGPLNKAEGGKELGTPFLNVLARSASSADNAQATSFFVINDEGIFLLKRLRGREALRVLGELPPRWADWSEEHWLTAAGAVKHKIADRRLEFPRVFPYYLGWNKQHSNAPGTTLFFPVVDTTRQMINALLILLSEPEGQRPFFLDDWQPFRPKRPSDWVAWAASRLGLIDPIPYHPIGGIRRVRSRVVDPTITIPLGQGGTLRTDFEAHLLMQNLQLIGQGMGLGGWIHSAILPPYMLHRDPAKGWYGLGFRFHQPEKKWRRWPPLPSTQPNPVGIDGVLEGLCPPYVTSMDDAVDQVLEEKHGAAGAYADKDVFARSYRAKASAEEFLRHAKPHPQWAIDYTKEICNYILDTYGRFPAHTDAFYMPGVWVQFSHLEMEYYERYYDPSLFRQQARHHALWDEQ